MTARAMVLLVAPPVTGKSGTLKTFLLRLFELSELEKVDRLLSLNGLGDGKPTPPPLLEDTAGTTAPVTARRQRDDGLCYYHA